MNQPLDSSEFADAIAEAFSLYPDDFYVRMALNAMTLEYMRNPNLNPNDYRVIQHRGYRDAIIAIDVIPNHEYEIGRLQ